MTATPPTVVLIRDSIRIGYESFVRAELDEIADVWAPEENGGDSRNVLDHLDAWAIDKAPAVIHLNCGLHDMKKDFETGTAAGQNIIATGRADAGPRAHR